MIAINITFHPSRLDNFQIKVLLPMQIQRGRPNSLDRRRLRINGLGKLGHFASTPIVQFVQGCLNGILPMLLRDFGRDLPLIVSLVWGLASLRQFLL